MTLRDLYKLLYQGVRGPEHLLLSVEIFTQRLEEEWQSLDSSEVDPLYEAVHPDGRLLRVNLRPYQAAGGQLDWLVNACLEAGRLTWGTRTDLQRTWEEFLALCRGDFMPNVPPEEIQTFTRWLVGNNFPPIHHSEQYRSLYKPSYRLVSAPITSGLIRSPGQD